MPWLDARYYAATQVMDEARHVEVYAKYLREKLEWEFPVNVHLRDLLHTVLADPRWDFTPCSSSSAECCSPRSSRT